MGLCACANPTSQPPADVLYTLRVRVDTFCVRKGAQKAATTEVRALRSEHSFIYFGASLPLPIQYNGIVPNMLGELHGSHVTHGNTRRDTIQNTISIKPSHHTAVRSALTGRTPTCRRPPPCPPCAPTKPAMAPRTRTGVVLLALLALAARAAAQDFVTIEPAAGGRRRILPRVVSSSGPASVRPSSVGTGALDEPAAPSSDQIGAPGVSGSDAAAPEGPVAAAASVAPSSHGTSGLSFTDSK